MNNSNDTSHLPPEGRCKAKRISDPLFGRAGTGTKQLGVNLELTSGPHAGALLPWYGFFTDGAIETTIKSMRALGWVGDVPSKGWPPLDSPENIEVDVVLKHERDQEGEWICRVRWINAPGVAMKDQMTAAELADFDKQMSGAIRRLAQGDTGGPPPNRQLPPRTGGNGNHDGPPPPSDDDAPPFDRRGGRNSGPARW